MKTKREFFKFIHANIQNVIREANNNLDAIGYGILLPHYSVNTSEINKDDNFFWDWDKIESKYRISMQVSDYDDLIILTEFYRGEY